MSDTHILDLKRMELSLQQSEERYRDLLDNANDLIQSVDPRGSFLYVNRAWKETLGYSDPEIASLKLFDVISPECRDHCSMLFGKIMLGETIPRVEVEFTAKDGRVVMLEGNINCSFVEGRPAVTRGIFRDITDRKLMEKELNQKEAQAKLIQSEKMTNLIEVIALASHELNNPVAGILGAVQLLRSSQPVAPAMGDEFDVLASIESAARRCQKIVDDLSCFSKQSRCNFSRTDVNQALRDTQEIMGEQYQQKGIEVRWRMAPDLPCIDADYLKLLEVFVNLLQNAKSALSDGGIIEISTRLVKRSAELQQVVIGIRDNGCGMPSQQLAKIFDPFFTTKPAGEGLGLGLTMSYRIIKRHRGEIDVRSRAGRGTTIIITLPVRQPKG